MLEVFNSSKDLKSLQMTINKNETKEILIFNDGQSDFDIDINCDVLENGHLSIYNVVTTNNKTKLSEVVNLKNINAECEIINVLLTDSNELESHIMINHLDKYTVSNFENYAIALGDAKMVLDNNAKINAGCSKSVVHQKAKGLTIGDKANIIAKPNLFIDEYDVIANHAASIGSISKDDLFYLMSRGLSLEASSKLVVLGFIKPLLDHINDEKIREVIDNSFTRML